MLPCILLESILVFSTPPNMDYSTFITVDYLVGQLEVDYLSNKNKHKNFQLVKSTKKQLKDNWRADYTGCLLATAIFVTLLLGLKLT